MSDINQQQEEQRKLNEATMVYKTLCSSLDNRKWTYDKDDEKLIVRTGAVGDDLTIKIYIKVDAGRSVMYLKSAMPFTTPKEKIEDMTRVITVANWTMLNGMFEMDRSDGYIGFKVVVPFMDSIISEKLCKYMIDMSCRMVDAYNDKFLAVSEGRMSIEEFETFAKTAI